MMYFIFVLKVYCKNILLNLGYKLSAVRARNSQ